MEQEIMFCMEVFAEILLLLLSLENIILLNSKMQESFKRFHKSHQATIIESGLDNLLVLSSWTQMLLFELEACIFV